MLGGFDNGSDGLLGDTDEAAIGRLLEGLTSGESDLPKHVMENLRECATMALFHGRRMGLESQAAFDALAALCLVLTERRAAFFENIFVKRMMTNPQLTAREKLNRMIEIIIGTIPRPDPCRSNDNTAREFA